LEAGDSIDDFLVGFPSVKREQVMAGVASFGDDSRQDRCNAGAKPEQGRSSSGVARALMGPWCSLVPNDLRKE
jgi:hypothetical protein